MTSAVMPSVPELLTGAGFVGPHIVYIDSGGSRADTIILTAEVPVTGGRAAPNLSDRERVIIRALLHLALDRLDAVNPHD